LWNVRGVIINVGTYIYINIVNPIPTVT
jgi:hypothetical protein